MYCPKNIGSREKMTILKSSIRNREKTTGYCINNQISENQL
jgi:hypothetical protein